MANPLYAILLDGGFLTKKLYNKLNRHATADDIVTECDRIQSRSEFRGYDLLTIYYYDAPPSPQAIQHPVSRTTLNLSTTQRFRLSQSLYDQLVLKPNFALRMGETRLSPQQWRLKTRVTRQLLAAPRPLVDNDFELDISQKGVDMRIGLDMARLALRETVRAVAVVTGDSDFIAAFKFARREGVRVFLHPMGHNVRPELRAHADVVFS